MDPSASGVLRGLLPFAVALAAGPLLAQSLPPAPTVPGPGEPMVIA